MAYAARFCALRRDCAGVRVSFSSLLLRRPWWSLSISKPMALSAELLDIIDIDACAGGDEDAVERGASPAPREESYVGS